MTTASATTTIDPQSVPPAPRVAEGSLTLADGRAVYLSVLLFSDRAFVTASSAPTFGTLVSAGAPAGSSTAGGPPLRAAGGGLGEGGEEDAGLPPARTLLGAPRGGEEEEEARGGGGGGGGAGGPELLARALAGVFGRALGLPVLLGCGVERVGVPEARELVKGVEALLDGLLGGEGRRA